MTIKQIEYFLKICEINQVSECAKQLGISQSAMSISIKNLENSLSGSLFDRRAKSLILNERGKAFKRSITPAYQKILEIEKNMRNSQMYDIKIMSSQNVGNYLLTSILENVLNLDLNINLELSINNTANIVNSIVENRCDLGLVEGIIRSDDVKIVKICDDNLIIVTGDPEFSKKSYYIDEISNYPWINREFGSGSRDILYNNLPEDITLNTVLEINSTEGVKRSVKNKKFFACLPKFTVCEELGKGLYEVKLKNIEFKRVLNLIYHKHKNESETFLKIVENLKENICLYHDQIV